MKPKILTFLFCSTMAAASVKAQSISFNPFASAPLSLNPAFTGLFDGKLRANVLYRRQWESVTVPVVSMAGSVDMLVLSGKNNYWAAGLQMFRGVAGDGNLANFQGFASLAFHQRFKHGIRLGAGVQGGYSQKTIDLSAIYFFDPLIGSMFPPVNYQPGMGNSVNYYAVNTGIYFSQHVNSSFKYKIAFSANNINQPDDAINKKTRELVGDDLYVNTVASVNWQITRRIDVRPSFLFQTSELRKNAILGSECHYHLLSNTKTLFAGVWYRTGDVSTLSAGVEMNRFRASLSYDYSIAPLNTSNSGSGGIEAAVRYILPQRSSR